MTRTSLALLLSLIAVVATAAGAAAHCEIPCGIYDDEMRIRLIYEHIATIEKSMRQIRHIESEAHHNANQLVRWIMNKEHHATELQHIVSQYFLTQRIKPETSDYARKLTLLHHMLLDAMRCKQTVDLDIAGRLRATVAEFQNLYFK